MKVEVLCCRFSYSERLEESLRASATNRFSERGFGKRVGQTVQRKNIAAISEKNGCRYKRIRKRPKNKPNEDIYRLKLKQIGYLEEFSRNGWIDLYYADESRVSLEANVPYGWQFSDEEVYMPVEKGGGLNLFAMIGRNNKLIYETIINNIDSQFIVEQLERFSGQLKKLTVVVLDNATAHTAKVIKERLAAWQNRGLYIFYLPTYSPHLNIAETLWRRMKYEWLSPSDYVDKQQLHYSVRKILGAVGNSLKIKFSEFNYSM